MWLPRLVSVAIILVAAVGYVLTAQYVSVQPLGPHKNFWDMLVFTLNLVCGLAPIAGIGGIIASFAYELDEHGCMRPRPNLLGTCISKIMPDDVKSFCGVGVVTGAALLGAVMIIAFVGLVLFLIVYEWNNSGSRFGLLIIGFFVAAYFAIRLADRFEVIATRIMYVIVCSVFVGFIGLIIYRIFFGEPLGDLDWAGLLMVFGVMVVTSATAGVFFLGLKLLKRLQLYARICPMRFPNKTQPTT